MKAYGYARVSLDEDGQAESITTQRAILESHAAAMGISLVDVFMDNNVSGFTFDRPKLLELIQLIEKGKVDLLIAKDLSRIGRHNARTLLFIDFLSDNDVRLVLAGGYDSAKDNDATLGIDTWANEYYLRDQSRKIRAGVRALQKNGMVDVEPFGYRKDPQNKHRLVVDEEAAAIVRRIFADYLAQAGTRAIANKLNSEGVPTPGMHKRSYQRIVIGQKDAHFKWSPTTVRKILEDESCIGIHHCGISRNTKLKGERMILPESERFIHRDYMPAIIGTEDFERAREMLQMRNRGRLDYSNKKTHKYAGILVCEACGSGFTVKRRINSYGERLVYVCSGHHKQGSTFCSSHSIDEVEIDTIVMGQLQTVIGENRLRMKELQHHIRRRDKAAAELQVKIARVEGTIERIRAEVKSYAKQLARKQIDLGMFDELNAAAQRDLARTEGERTYLQQLAVGHGQMDKTLLSHMHRLSDLIDAGRLTHADVAMLLKSIRVRESTRLGWRNKPEIELAVEWWMEALIQEDDTQPTAEDHGDIRFANAPQRIGTPEAKKIKRDRSKKKPVSLS